MAKYDSTNLFVKLDSSQIASYTNQITDNGQLGFVVPKDGANNKVSYLYAQGDTFGDGALSNKTYLTESITIAGGPLESQFKIAFGDTLPAGTTLQSLLKNLLCVELFPSVSIQSASLNLSNSAPTITGVKSTSLYFVDSIQNITVTPRGAEYIDIKDSVISGLTYGYFYDNGKDEFNQTIYAFKSDKSITNTIAYNLTKQSYLYCKKSDYNGTDSSYTTYAASGSDLPSAKIIKCKTKIGNNNKVEAYSNNASCYYYCNAISYIWPKSNLGNRGTTSYYVAAVPETTVNATTSKASSLSWKGVYPVAYGTGSISGIFTATEGTQLTRTFTVETASKRAIIQFPGNRNIKIEQNTTVGWQNVASYSISDTTISYGGVDYKQMTLGGNPNTAGSFELRFTFDKALNS